MTTRDPNEFWRKIKQLGPRSDKSIPVEIIDNGLINRNEGDVFDRWKQEFKNLYNRDDDSDFDEEYYNQSKLHKHLIEMHIEDPLYTTNEQMNCNITIDEITNIIMRAKSGSATGIDKIPYDVLKYPLVITALQKLFQLIFDTSVIPSIWRKAIICPILKDQTSDIDEYR